MLLAGKRSARPPWMPSLSLAFRIFIFLRFTAAMYTGISDCDEGMASFPPLTPLRLSEQQALKPELNHSLTRPLVCRASASLQLLGTSSLLLPQLGLPDLGALSAICRSVLGLRRSLASVRRGHSVFDDAWKGKLPSLSSPRSERRER